jgi:hypothetical protein
MLPANIRIRKIKRRRKSIVYIFLDVIIIPKNIYKLLGEWI